MSQRDVLVIDFEPRSLQGSCALLEASGFAVKRVGSLAEVDALFEHLDAIPSIVVLEPMLPGLDGFKLCRNLKSTASADGPRHVLVGSRIFQGARYRSMAREAGADLFYRKPAENELMLETVVRLASGEQRPAASGAQASASVSASTVATGASKAVAGQSIEHAISQALTAEDAESARKSGAGSGEVEGEDDPLSLADSFSVPAQQSTPDATPAQPAPKGAETSAPQQPVGGAEHQPTPGAGVASSSGEQARHPTGEQVIDNLLERALTGSGDSEVADAPSDAEQAINDMFSGAQSRASGGDAPVPAGLKGMDSGTAELLSSLEELEHSVPQGSDADEAAVSSAERALEIETSVPLKPPPGSLDEETLGSLLEDVQAEEPPEPAPSPAGPKVREDDAKAAADPASSNKKLVVYLGVAAIALITAGIGIWLMRSDGPEPTVAAEIAAQGPVAVEQPATPETDIPAGTGETPEGLPAESSPNPAVVTEAPEPVPAGPSPEVLAARERSQAEAERLRREREAAQAALAAVTEEVENTGGVVEDALLDSTLSLETPEIVELGDEVLVSEDVAPPEIEPQISGINGVSMPKLIESSRVKPDYPPAARKLGVGGKVIMQAVILRDGSVGEIQVLSEPAGNYGFGRAAMQALEDWKYEPAMKGGYAVDAYLTVTINFAK